MMNNKVAPAVDNINTPSKKVSNTLPLEDNSTHGHITSFTVLQLDNIEKK